MTQMKQKQNKSGNLKLQKINRILFLLIIITGVMYLIGTNDVSIKSYVLQQHKKQAMKLRNDNNDLELKTMSLSSYNNLSKRVENLKLVKVDKIDYINTNNAVALGR
ncbi:MAG: hypothetical protein UT48_C0008G0041 [Parcubacteria group bacterium GW2011_GWE2_39_37]|nr:MAG: hypothetical protein UT48_C0008G0041 [Parcubacteria group bacterium GW2011_GWE2_39_37]